MIISRACRAFAEEDGGTFWIGYLHGLAYSLDYSTKYMTVMMLVSYLQKNINMEGEPCTLTCTYRP